MKTIRIATRESPLALWQAEHVAGLLRQQQGVDVQLVGMTTQGDQILDSPLAKIGGKGLFVKELEKSLLLRETDIAVHSMKDVPVEFPDGLGLAVILEREDPRDAFVSNHFDDLAALPLGAKVGTSSLRRQCQIRAMRPDLVILDLRGNVQTRLSKLDAGQYDAIILAAAGLKRLRLDTRIRALLTPEQSLPAIGQGAIGIECRVDDAEMVTLLATLNHRDTQDCVMAERAMNERLHGGCQVPIAGFALLQQEQMYVRGIVGQPDGKLLLKAQATGPRHQARQLGIEVAESLLAQGADQILAALRDY